MADPQFAERRIPASVRSVKPEYDDHVVIGPRIKGRREKLGLTQRDLAEKAGIPQPTLARIETERNEPKLRQIVAIAGVLTGGSVDALLRVDPKEDVGR